MIASTGGDLNRAFKSGPISAERLGPEAGGIYILDNSDLAAGKRDPKLRLIGTARPKRAGHRRTTFEALGLTTALTLSVSGSTIIWHSSKKAEVTL